LFIPISERAATDTIKESTRKIMTGISSIGIEESKQFRKATGETRKIQKLKTDTEMSRDNFRDHSS